MFFDFWSFFGLVFHKMPKLAYNPSSKIFEDVSDGSMDSQDIDTDIGSETESESDYSSGESDASDASLDTRDPGRSRKRSATSISDDGRVKSSLGKESDINDVFCVKGPETTELLKNILGEIKLIREDVKYIELEDREGTRGSLRYVMSGLKSLIPPNPKLGQTLSHSIASPVDTPV